MASHYTFLSPGILSKESLLSSVGEPYTLEPEPRSRAMLTLYDTFDWRLYNSGLWLARTGDLLVLMEVQTGEPIERLPLDTQPAFAWDFPEGSFRDRISPALFVRALIPRMDAKVETRLFRLLDDQQKTIARLELQHFRVGAGRRPGSRLTAVSLTPLRGYFRPTGQVAKALVASGLIPAKMTDAYPLMLQGAGKTPGDYSSKPSYQLDPEMGAAEAARIILRHLLKIIKANEAGIKADIDTEFLHDYRVSIRRTRSALTQIKGVFPAKDVGRFKSDFAYLGQLTNPLRDLDVYLLKESAYREMLPDGLKSDINPLFDYLKHKRVQAYRGVVRGLGTKKYDRILGDWEKFLDSPAENSAPPTATIDIQEEEETPPADPDAPNADVPVIKLAKSRIRKWYGLVVRTGNEILQTERDESLHMLRIECKKLRYLLEFFSSLFPSEPMENLVKQLKRLQDNLGDFNDLTVQQGYLLGIAAEIPHTGEESVRTLLAIGALVGELEARQREVKAAFAGTFREFSSPEVESLFEELFGKKPKPKAD